MNQDPTQASGPPKRSLGAELRAVLFLYGIVLVLALFLRSLGR